MFTRALLALFGAFIFAVSAMPARAGDMPESLLAAHDAMEVPLAREDGGLWVDVRINDRVTSRMLIDTGASVVILPRRVAAALDIQEEGRRQQLRTVKGPASGRMITLSRVGVGAARVSGVQAIVLEEGDDEDSVGLLGRSFLNHFTFSVDQDRNVLSLKPRQGGADVAWQGLAPGALQDQQLAQLRREHHRALQDRNSSPRYIARLEEAVARLERQRQGTD